MCPISVRVSIKTSYKLSLHFAHPQLRICSLNVSSANGLVSSSTDDTLRFASALYLVNSRSDPSQMCVPSRVVRCYPTEPLHKVFVKPFSLPLLLCAQHDVNHARAKNPSVTHPGCPSESSPSSSSPGQPRLPKRVGDFLQGIDQSFSAALDLPHALSLSRSLSLLVFRKGCNAETEHYMDKSVVGPE